MHDKLIFEVNKIILDKYAPCSVVYSSSGFFFSMTNPSMMGVTET